MSIIKLNHQTNFQTTEPQSRAVGDMAILYPATKTRTLSAQALAQRKLPVVNLLDHCDFDPSSNKIKIMPMKVSKGLGFPVVALPDMGQMRGKGENQQQATRVPVIVKPGNPTGDTNE